MGFLTKLAWGSGAITALTAITFYYSPRMQWFVLAKIVEAEKPNTSFYSPEELKRKLECGELIVTDLRHDCVTLKDTTLPVTEMISFSNLTPEAKEKSFHYFFDLKKKFKLETPTSL